MGTIGLRVEKNETKDRGFIGLVRLHGKCVLVVKTNGTYVKDSNVGEIKVSAILMQQEQREKTLC